MLGTVGTVEGTSISWPCSSDQFHSKPALPNRSGFARMLKSLLTLHMDPKITGAAFNTSAVYYRYQNGAYRYLHNMKIFGKVYIILKLGCLFKEKGLNAVNCADPKD